MPCIYALAGCLSYAGIYSSHVSLRLAFSYAVAVALTQRQRRAKHCAAPGAARSWRRDALPARRAARALSRATARQRITPPPSDAAGAPSRRQQRRGAYGAWRRRRGSITSNAFSVAASSSPSRQRSARAKQQQTTAYVPSALRSVMRSVRSRIRLAGNTCALFAISAVTPPTRRLVSSAAPRARSFLVSISAHARYGACVPARAYLPASSWRTIAWLLVLAEGDANSAWLFIATRLYLIVR